MIKKLVKKVPGTRWLNNLMLEKQIMRNFLNCSEKELDQATFYKQFIKKNDLVFDVGCNVGCRTKLFLNIDAKVVAFEPQSELCNHLLGHLKRNKRFKLERVALGKETGTAQLHICEAHVLSSLSQRWIHNTNESGRFSSYQWKESICVPTTTLDQMIEKYGKPKFIKIDVEGYEFEVLQGLTCPINFISIEFTSEDIENSIKCLDYLVDLGECFFQYSLGESLTFPDHKWKKGNDFKGHLERLCRSLPKCWGDIYVKINNS